MARRVRRLASSTGEPEACGLCGKAIIAGLRFGAKGANQAMTPVGNGRIHIDRKLCKALEGKTYEELDGPKRPTFPTPQKGSVGDDTVGDVLHPVGSVGVDQARDGR